MGTLYTPRLTEADHEALRHLVHNYPAATYDKWLQLQAKEIADWNGGGGKVVLVDISVDDVTRYCGQTGARCNVQVLKAIAAAKGIGKFE